ncbi:transcriptional regulator [Pedobacter petrophilus]|uniref:Transcriptional regulator n=1 Tax=Pedobacter petrophilus TaxID=1908241 RepID=A0A7K0G2B9_9SPHI|nr:helix-turn-helix domain-containing protein [Pedobacter petrophilus]MRX77590.1 transcriptional regulator [Pedobacter petrophilus]
MIENNSKNFSDTCPVRSLLDRIGDKWSILVISLLGKFGTQRFGELNQKIETVSQKMLTITLKNLEADGLISRKMYAQIPPRVEYTLTDLGRSLLPAIASLVDWATVHIPEVMESRERYKNKAVE